jgi:hypothetical protein
MTIKIYLLVIVVFSAFMSACAVGEASSGGKQEVVFDDGSSRQNKNEIVITDADIDERDLAAISGEKTSREQTVIAADKSKITTTFDTYGNKTETRCFVNHPRLDCVVVMTPANGKKQMLVYPVGSGAKDLPENEAEKVLTASADELANIAGVYETRDDIAKKPVSPYGRKKGSQTLRPLPSSEFPVFPKMIPQTPVETIEEDQVQENASKTSKQIGITTSKPEFEDEK